MQRPLIVLKLGGSVLTDRDALRRAVHEIYRWHREGWRVIAVPSALAGVTDARLRAATDYSPRIRPHALAASLALGETQSAAELNLVLDRAGVPSVVLSPGAIGLRAAGPALDADPIDVNADRIRAALRHSVAIIPGFLGIDAAGATVTLGRGGSDLTALFLAHRLRADKCRLIKDVDGLYRHDPALPGPPPDRYTAITWADALRLDGSIVQHKAVAFALEHAISFEVTRINGVDPTIVGPGPSRLEPPVAAPARLSIALLGFGTVGAGVHALARELPGVEIRAIARRRPVPPDAAIDGVPFVPADRIPTLGADVVIEAIGGVDPARSLIAAALQAGSHVITANKSVIAAHGPELRALADRAGVRLLFSASVGGSVPVLEHIRFADQPVIALRGILNGTTNFVLDRIASGEPWPRALAEARSIGLAEADPSRDLDGQDAADKLAVIAQISGAPPLRTTAIPRDPLSPQRLQSASGPIPRQVAAIAIDADSARASVRIQELDPQDPLATITEESNGVELRFRDHSTRLIHGRGAGRWPTAESVLGDLLELIRDRGAAPAPSTSRETALAL